MIVLKETEIGSIPQEWQLVRLEEIADKLKAGGTPKTTNKSYWDGDIPLVKVEDVVNSNKYLERTNLYITKQGLDNSSAYLLPPNSIVFTMYGTAGEVAINKMSVAPTQNVLGIIKSDKVDTEFLYYALKFSKTRALELIVDRTIFKHFTLAKAKNLLIALPSSSEQSNIVKTLSIIQSAIEIQEKIIQSTTELKKALMQKLFTEGLKGEPRKETEIGLVPKSWEVVPMSKVIIDAIQNGAFIKKPKYGKGILYVNVEDIYESAFISYDSLQRIDVTLESIKNYLLKENDIVFVRSSLKRDGIGQSCLIVNLKEPTFYDCHLIKISPNQDKIMPEYLVYYWRSSLGKTELIRRSKTTTMTTINQQSLAQAMLPLPPIREQKEISNILDGIDRKIGIALSKKTVFTTLFKSMLHHLMTGQIRVKDLKLA